MDDAQGGKNWKKDRDRKARRQTLQSLVMITQFGIQMMVPIFLCTFLGIWIDKKADTSYWVIILFFVGALAGFNNIYRLVKKMNDRK